MRMLRLGVFAAIALSCAACQTLGNDRGDAAPRAAFDQFIAAFNSLDWEAFRRCFADSASLFNPDIPDAISLHRLDGRDDIERNFRAVFDAADAGTNNKRSPNIYPENVRLQRFGDTAIITFEFKRSGISTGRRTIVFNKLKGSWLIVHIHASNVTPR
jgi:ketosteroid isomerase-like protein